MNNKIKLKKGDVVVLYKWEKVGVNVYENC